MEKYVCKICGYVYDPEEGDPDGGDVAGICTVLRILFERGG